jgi:hypothetical protein
MQMAEAVHEVAHEATHEAAHSGKSQAKMIGLLISILALFLAVSEMVGKSAQTHGLALNIEASDTWNFFQAKTIRQTVLRAQVDNAKMMPDANRPEVAKQIAAWQANIDRWESEPSTNEGRKELMAKARAIEKKRDAYLEQYHAYEIASLLLQLGIVLASVTLLSSITWFALGSIGMGGIGLLVLVGAYLKLPFVMALVH